MKTFSAKIITAVLTAGIFTLGACAPVDSQMGGEAPDFTLETASGGRITLSEELKKGKAVVVFFTTWCPYCVSEVPEVNELYRSSGDTLSVFAIDIQESPAKVRNFTAKHEVEYPVALDADGSVASAYGVRGIPAVFAMGEKGDILYSGHSMSEMRKKTGI